MCCSNINREWKSTDKYSYVLETVYYMLQNVFNTITLNIDSIQCTVGKTVKSAKSTGNL